MQTFDRNLVAQPGDTSAADFDAALTALKRGHAVVFPTETFYGLGVNAMDARAVERLFAIKQREAEKPVALIASDFEMVSRAVGEIPQPALRLARRFWPGPLTIVLPARPELPRSLINREGGVGIRVSAHPIARELARRLSYPLTATSANRADHPPARTIHEAKAAFGRSVKVYLDGGSLEGSMPSTVIVFKGMQMKIVRSGAIPENQLREALSGS